MERSALLDAASFVKRAVGSLRRDRYAGRFFECQRLRFAREGNHRDDSVFRIAAALAREAQHLVACLPARDALPD
jgi:hypothetical protein